MKSELIPNKKTTFIAFYKGAFTSEHRHPGTIAFHVLGTILGAAYFVYFAIQGPLWFMIFFPVVHAVPGLAGHRLFERNAQVGDTRVLRKDYPLVWFIASNHLMCFDLLRGRYGQ